MSFCGWNLFGSVANLGAQQGVNILLNIFLGVTVNAAMGVANQVSSAIYQFISNFQTAFSPQIVKSYSSNDQTYFMSLIFKASKFSYYLMFFLALPILLNTGFILQIWLEIVPDHATSFCRLIIIFLLIDAISAPLWMSVQATGLIRNYQILMGSLIILNLPLSYIFLKLGYPPESVIIIRVIINLICFFVRMVYLKSLVSLPLGQYFREVVYMVFLVSFLSLPLPLILDHYMSNYIGLVVTTIVSILSTGLSIYVVGLTKNEKDFLNRLILNKIRKWNQEIFPT